MERICRILLVQHTWKTGSLCLRSALSQAVLRRMTFTYKSLEPPWRPSASSELPTASADRMLLPLSRCSKVQNPASS